MYPKTLRACGRLLLVLLASSAWYAGNPVPADAAPDGDWYQSFSQQPPPGRAYPLLTYVSSFDAIFLVGGMCDGWHGCDDTWVFDLSDPIGLFVSGPIITYGDPGELIGSAAVYDAVRDRILVFGGGHTVLTSDVVSLPFSGPSPRTWQVVPTVGTPPVGRRFASVIIDPIGDRMIMYGGTPTLSGTEQGLADLWQLTLSDPMTWTRIEPSGFPPSQRFKHTAVYDPVRHRMLMFAGTISGTLVTTETWELTLDESPMWTHLVPSGNPANPTSATAVYDPKRDRLVVFNAAGGAWELKLAPLEWRPLTTSANHPPSRFTRGVALDPVRDRLVVFGGDGSAACGICGPTLYNDAWSLVFPQPPTGVDPPGVAARPMDLHAYPNPSSASTTLEFRLPADRVAHVTVHDPSGRLVRDIFSGTLPIGTQRLDWDGRTCDGSVATPGLYFVRARLGDQELRRAIVRMR
jgi:FlgD Ig-like domain